MPRVCLGGYTCPVELGVLAHNCKVGEASLVMPGNMVNIHV